MVLREVEGDEQHETVVLKNLRSGLGLAIYLLIADQMHIFVP